MVNQFAKNWRSLVQQRWKERRHNNYPSSTSSKLPPAQTFHVIGETCGCVSAANKEREAKLCFSQVMRALKFLYWTMANATWSRQDHIHLHKIRFNDTRVRETCIFIRVRNDMRGIQKGTHRWIQISIAFQRIITMISKRQVFYDGSHWKLLTLPTNSM